MLLLCMARTFPSSQTFAAVQMGDGLRSKKWIYENLKILAIDTNKGPMDKQNWGNYIV